MRIQVSAALTSIVLVAGFAFGSPVAIAGDHSTLSQIQYGQYRDRPDNYYPQERYYPDRRDGYYPSQPPRGAYDRAPPLWRPGDVLPPELLDYVVDDWEPRGLERPPGGHQWVRVGYQFILVRERDRMIARVINFD